MSKPKFASARRNTCQSNTNWGRRLSQWEEEGRWPDIWRILLADIDEQGHLDCSESFTGGSSAPAQKGKAVGPTRRGKGTKWTVVVDGRDVPLGKHLTVPSPHECTLIEATLDASAMPEKIQRLIYDKAAASSALRQGMAARAIDLIAPCILRTWF